MSTAIPGVEHVAGTKQVDREKIPAHLSVRDTTAMAPADPGGNGCSVIIDPRDVKVLTTTKQPATDVTKLQNSAT